MEYFGLKLGQDFGNRAAHPTKNSEEYPPPPRVSFGFKIILHLENNCNA